MTLFRYLSFAFVAVAVTAGFSADAKADPMISLSGAGWELSKSSGDLYFICKSNACGGDGFVGFSKIRTRGNDELALRSQSISAQAYMKEVLPGNSTHFKLPEINRFITKDYVAIRASGSYRGAPFSAIIIVQDHTIYIISSTAPTPKLAKENLAKAFKSGDFRRNG